MFGKQTSRFILCTKRIEKNKVYFLRQDIHLYFIEQSLMAYMQKSGQAEAFALYFNYVKTSAPTGWKHFTEKNYCKISEGLVQCKSALLKHLACA